MTSPIQTLEVLGIGAQAAMFSQSKLLMEMDKAGDRLLISQDPKLYYWSASNRLDMEIIRSADALEHAASYFVRGWPIPGVSITGKHRFDADNPEESFSYDKLSALKQKAGLHGHLMLQLQRIFSDLPEETLEKAFQFFDANPEVPALLLFAADDDPKGDGDHKETDPTQASAAIILARRDRVEPLRPYTRASSGPNAYKEVQPSGMPPFAKGRFFQYAWLDWQIKQFDDLPTLGIVHRPIRISYMQDKDGKPTFDPAQKKKTLSDHDKQTAFQAAWKKSAALFPAGRKPARIFYDHGDAAHGRQLVPLTLALHLQDPQFDFAEPKQTYNLHRRLGNVGAVSPFLMLSLGTMSSYLKQDISVAVSLRDPNTATIVVVTPAGDKRKHPAGHPFDFGLAPPFADHPAPPATDLKAVQAWANGTEHTVGAVPPSMPVAAAFDPDRTMPETPIEQLRMQYPQDDTGGR